MTQPQRAAVTLYHAANTQQGPGGEPVVGAEGRLNHRVTPLRVALVAPLPPPAGGMANQARQLARLLQEAGVAVEVVQTNAPYRPQWVSSVRGLRALFRLVPFLGRLWSVAGRVDLIHVMANSGWSWHLFVAPAVWIARLRGAAVVVNYRGGDAAEFFERSFRWVRPTMAALDARLVPSGYLKNVFERFGIDAEIVPNIIDLGRFKRKARPHLDVERPRLIVTRNLEPLYDIQTAVRAFALVHGRYPGAHLTVAGSGPERERLLALARELGVDSCVTFTGSVDNQHMQELLADADVLVNSSLHDNMPISFLEALATGVPIVSSNVCGIPFLVEDGKTAILVPPRDAASLADGVLRLLGDPQMAERMIDAGFELVQQYGWQHVRPRLLGIYSDLIERRRARR